MASNYKVDERTSISSPFFRIDSPLKVKLISNDVYFVGQLLNYRATELLEFDNIIPFNVSVIVKALNDAGFHIQEEEMFDISYWIDEDTSDLLKKCDYIAHQIYNLRRMAEKEDYIAELNVKLKCLLDQVFEIQCQKNKNGIKL